MPPLGHACQQVAAFAGRCSRAHNPTSGHRCTPGVLLQVAAFADGRSAVHEYDCLLLEFVLGQRPDDAHVSLSWTALGRRRPWMVCVAA